EYGTETIPDVVSVVNPQWRTLDSLIRSKTGQRYRLAAQFGALTLSENPAESELHSYPQRKGELQEQIQHLDLEIDGLKQQPTITPSLNSAPRSMKLKRFSQAPTSR